MTVVADRSHFDVVLGTRRGRQAGAPLTLTPPGSWNSELESVTLQADARGETVTVACPHRTTSEPSTLNDARRTAGVDIPSDSAGEVAAALRRVAHVIHNDSARDATNQWRPGDPEPEHGTLNVIIELPGRGRLLVWHSAATPGTPRGVRLEPCFAYGAFSAYSTLMSADLASEVADALDRMET